MNKLFFSVLILLILLPTVLATDIAYIVKNPSAPDVNFISAINQLGYTYSLIDDSEIPYTDFNDYGMILLGDENINNVPVNTYKSLIVNPSYYTSWSGSVGSRTSGGLMTAYNYAHMITDDTAGLFQVYTTSSKPMYYLSGRKYSTQAVTVKGESTADKGYYVIATKQLPRRVFFGITESNYWTQASKNLFKNSIRWVLIGEDGDEDGYYYDVDCNDSNPEIWQNLPGYLDADEDGYGTGNLLDVCSGDSLREGYSEINGDCNDANEDANPDGIEIPYNSIDEDCSGGDLVDVDEDGYIAEIVGGNDCDDDDALINPGSTDVYKNCKNDKPIVQAISKITVSESETAIIEVLAEDPEDDSLDYSINSPDFTQTDNNIFEWETDYDDYGDYDFTITVSDGLLQTQIVVEVKVNNVNRAPECSEIPEQEWPEDTTHELDLRLYCSDPDGEIIKYYFNETSSDEHISLDSLNSDTGLAEFSVEENWNGEDWIKFKVSDGKSEAITNEIVLRVTGINDAPEFNSIIQDIQWNEDTNCINCLNLANYFLDADIPYGDELTFEVSPSLNIDIQIDENGQVSFVPLPDYYGTETVVFRAIDSELESVYSHSVNLIVLDMNEPPEFQAMNCQTEILEDTEYNCQLEATDFENNPLTFTISNQNNLVCEIENNQLVYYTSALNYNGLASCTIKVEDGNNGQDTYNLEVNVNPVNDAPTITSYSPTQSDIRILEGQTKSFSITATDIDGDVLTITWKLNDIQVGTGNNYLFSQPVGSYNLKAEVSDGNGGEANHEWSVFVGDINDFTCQEVGGFILKENQACPVNGELLETLDSNIIKCCSVAGEPAFSDVKRCQNLDGKIEIDIKKPDSEEDFKVGDTINAKVDIENNVEEDNLDFDVIVSFYDLTDDNKIEDFDDSINNLDQGDKETIEASFVIDEDIESENEYAIFVKVVEESGDTLLCNEAYTPINIEREDNDVRIEEFIMQTETAICGDYILASAKIKNLGADSQDAYLVIENSELGIKQKTETFEIEEYGEKNKASQSLQFQIPDKAQAGKYEIKATVFYDDENEKSSISKTLVLEECKELKQETAVTGQISLQGEKKEIKVKINDKSRTKEIALMISTLIALSVVSFLLYLIPKKSY